MKTLLGLLPARVLMRAGWGIVPVSVLLVAALSAAASSMLASMTDSLPPEGFKTLADGVATTLGAKFTELANTPMETD